MINMILNFSLEGEENESKSIKGFLKVLVVCIVCTLLLIPN